MDTPGLLTPALGFSGLAVAIILAIVRGYLVPRATVSLLTSAKDQQIETWKTIAEREKKLSDAQQKQIEMLLEGNRTTVRVMEALPVAARMSREGGGPDAAVAVPQEGP